MRFLRSSALANAEKLRLAANCSAAEAMQFSPLRHARSTAAMNNWTPVKLIRRRQPCAKPDTRPFRLGDSRKETKSHDESPCRDRTGAAKMQAAREAHRLHVLNFKQPVPAA